MSVVIKKASDITRLENLRLLEIAYGSRAALAEGLGVEEKFINKFLKKKDPYAINAELAGKMEEKLGKPKGWMGRKNCKLALTSDEWQLLDAYRAGTNRDRAIIMTLANIIETMQKGK